MRQFNLKIVFLLLATLLLSTACHDDLLNQPSSVDLPSYYYWKTVDDAEYVLNGAKADVRGLFDRDYYFDGMGEYLRVRGNTISSNAATMVGGVAYRGFYQLDPISYGYSFSNMYTYCYAGIHRANYVIEGVENMLETIDNPTIRKDLERVVGEARLLRGLVYFKLICMWGDVPYIDYRIHSNEEALLLSRTPIAEIYRHILADLEYAYQKLPEKSSIAGNFAQPAALALRGKIHLFWASWNRFGWPELDSFTPNDIEAAKAYRQAAEDFNKVIHNYGLSLFRNGDPGECDELGKAEKLPNYYHLFLPTANGDPEFILYFNHGGTGTGQGDELMRDFAGRSVEYSQCWISPRFAIADRYQSLETGDFCPPLVKLDPSRNPDARTRENSALNPQSYANRDYRMKSTIMWDFEVCMGIDSKVEVGYVPYIYKTWGEKVVIDGVEYTTYNTDGTNTGYVFRKFVRNYSNGQDRSSGNFNWPVIRLADVYLMYAEAVNFGNVGEWKQDAIEMVNRVRRRANLPDLKPEKTATEEDFFRAIEQERIVELIGEGHRGWDIRRWRAIEKNFSPVESEDGYIVYDTWGNETNRYWHYQNHLAYERCYIFQIPESERDRNPNLTQNKPFR